MIFSSFRFLLFFPLVLLLHQLWRGTRGRQVLLLVASYVFYASWDARFLVLVLGSTLLDWSIGLALARARAPAARRALLGLSLVGNLGALCFFKYLQFVLDSLRAGLAWCGLHVDPAGALAALTGLPYDAASGHLGILLPVGISFYTFQTLSYTVDVYRGRLQPTRDLVSFALFVAFFPQLVAGPIVRAVELLPQIARDARARWDDVAAGLQRFAVGFGKKLLVADNVAPFVDRIFADSGAYDGATLWLASLGFAVQVYCDFSGYSDMAIGSARMLGFRLPENFRFPFTALNVADFWRRWHITLYSFMRDYVYVPLGGSRVSPGRRVANVLLTMTLVGLWHGAAWQFVLWGLFNGVAVVVAGLLALQLVARPRLGAALERPAGVLLRVAVVNVVFVLGLGIFRSLGMEAVLLTLARMLGLSGGGVRAFDPAVLIGYAAVLAGCVAAELDLPARLRARTPVLMQPVVWAALVVTLVLLGPDGTAAFVYFQF